jgi:CheY-like chemotaxis protein
MDPQPPDPSRPTILVVDDDPMLGGVVASCLDFEGASVLTAHTLADARPLLDEGLHHIVLDRRMPDGDGLELLDDIQARCPEVPVVVFSALDDGAEPAHVQRVDKSDMATLVQVLGLGPEVPELPEDRLLRIDVARDQVEPG